MAEADEETHDAPDETPRRWPVVVWLIVVVGMVWFGVEIFFLQAAPIDTLEHLELTSDQGAQFEVAEPGQEYVVRVWTYRAEDGDRDRLKRASGEVDFAVMTPADDVAAEHADASPNSRARYVSFVPDSAGDYRVRVDRIAGADKTPDVQARVFTGNRQVLIPIISQLLGRERP